jgi:hypothetical protein
MTFGMEQKTRKAENVRAREIRKILLRIGFRVAWKGGGGRGGGVLQNHN